VGRLGVSDAAVPQPIMPAAINRMATIWSGLTLLLLPSSCSGPTVLQDLRLEPTETRVDDPGRRSVRPGASSLLAITGRDIRYQDFVSQRIAAAGTVRRHLLRYGTAALAGVLGVPSPRRMVSSPPSALHPFVAPITAIFATSRRALRTVRARGRVVRRRVDDQNDHRHHQRT